MKTIPEQFTVIPDNIYTKYTVGKFFEEYVLQEQYYPYQFDGWYDKKFYGLLDTRGRAIYPKDTSLKVYTNSSGRELKNIFFVQEAFNDMRNYHLSLIQENKFNKTLATIFVNADPISSTDYLDDIYTDYLQKTFTIFSDTFLTIPRKDSIKNVHDFSRQFVDFLKIYLQFASFNRSTFITSKVCPQNISGLTLSFDNRQAFTDYDKKANQYYDDQNFYIFYESAQRYGFYVDRNIPWKIIADLGSPVMLSYSQRYGLTNADDIFNNLYYVAYYADLDNIKNIMIAFWNGYCTSISNSIIVDRASSCREAFVQITSHEPLTIKLFDQHFSRTWLLRLYLFSKLLENNISISQASFENLNKEITKIDKYYGERTMLDTIDLKIKELRSLSESDENLLTDPQLAVKLLQSAQAVQAKNLIF